MNRLQGVSLVSLVLGLVLAAFVVPWSLSTINKTAQMQQQILEQLEPAAVPAPDPAAVAAAKAEADARIAAKKAADEQTARIQAEMAKIAIPRPEAKPAPEPPRPAYSFVPRGSAELVPLEGWVDQPNKNRSGRVHTDLMVRHVRPSAKPRTPARAPCLKMVSKPAERIVRPYGHIDVPARTIPVACAG